MGSKGNFTQALRELTGFDETPEKKRTEDVIAEDVKPEEIKVEEIKNSYTYVQQEQTVIEKSADSHITSTMVIKGKVRSEGNIFVEGSVYGNIVTAGDISIKNIVFGDIKGENIYLSDARVKGNVKSDEKVNVGEKTILVGDVTASNIIVSGKVKGDLCASDTTVLEQDAVVSGNIVTGNILSNSGASLKGSITTTGNANIDDDTEFDLGVEIYEQ